MGTKVTLSVLNMSTVFEKVIIFWAIYCFTLDPVITCWFCWFCRHLWMMFASRSRCTSPWSWRTSWGLDMISFHCSSRHRCYLCLPRMLNRVKTELFSVLLEILHYRDQYVDVECVFVYHCALHFLNLPVSHTNLFTVVKGELTVPEEALKVNTLAHNPSHTRICQHSSFCGFLFIYSCISWSTAVFPHVLQHEKFTSGLQLSHKPCSSETSTSSHKSPAKTPTKVVKSPSGGRATADGLPSSRDSQTKPSDSHKAEERTGGEE